MRKFLALILSLIVVSSAPTDYSSLSSDELGRVRKAFEQAKFYPVYADLAAGKDTLTIEKVEQLSEAYFGENKFVSRFRYTVVLRAGGHDFRRTFEQDTLTEVDPKTLCGSPSLMSKILDTTGKIAMGAGIGALAVLGACK